MKVYIATSGCYSDYSIDNVFLNEEDAQAYAALNSDAGVESYELHEGPVERRVRYRLTWWPHIEDRKGGSYAAANPNEFSYTEDYDPDRKLSHRWETRSVGPFTEAILHVEGWDRQDVLKVYSEQRAVHLARKDGIA